MQSFTGPKQRELEEPRHGIKKGLKGFNASAERYQENVNCGKECGDRPCNEDHQMNPYEKIDEPGAQSSRHLAESKGAFRKF